MAIPVTTSDSAKDAWQARIAERDRRERSLIAAIQERKHELQELLQQSQSHWEYEDSIYRFYHQSFKVYFIQQTTQTIVKVLRELQPERDLNAWFMEIVEAGIGREFTDSTNKNWQAETRPMLEAFFHAKYFLEMICRYADQIEEPPQTLPSGWASVLYLYNLR